MRLLPCDNLGSGRLGCQTLRVDLGAVRCRTAGLCEHLGLHLGRVLPPARGATDRSREAALPRLLLSPIAARSLLGCGLDEALRRELARAANPVGTAHRGRGAADRGRSGATLPAA